MTDKNTKSNSKRRHRSPAYPALSLSAAIEKLTAFYKKEGLVKIPVSAALQSLGYDPASSNGFRTIASMLSFGLFEAEGIGEKRQVWLSPLGKKILLDKREKSPERDQAIIEAALKPEIHQWLWGEYAAGLPSDDTLETVLLTELNFNPNAVSEFIKEIRDTYRFAKLTESDIMSGESENSQPIIDKKGRSGGAKMQDITIPLIGATAVLRLPLPLSKKNYSYLVKWLGLMEEPLTLSEEVQTSAEQEKPEGKEESQG